MVFRMEDLDRAVAGADARQLADLASLGMDAAGDRMSALAGEDRRPVA